MAVEGLKSTYIIPFIKKDREIDPHKKKQKRDPKKQRKKDEGRDKKTDGKVDIRI